MIHRNMKIKTKKILKNIFAITMVISMSMSSFLNIIEAAIYTNLPRTEIRYDAADNSTVFPESYKQYIRNLKALHPNWIFKAVYTGLDWDQSILHESYDINPGISTVPMSYSSNWKKDGVDYKVDGPFVIASKKAVAYTLDPRNYLNETGIFQFEALDFNSETSTGATIDKVISGTPMASNPTKYKRSNAMVDLENSLTWTQLIINSAKNVGGNGISAVFLASRMRQETSLDILNNGSINGSHETYPGIYNFFNMGATPNADGSGSVTNGLAYASGKGWTTPQKSIEAGAKSLWENYIQWGQNTTYFQKFDVSNPYGNATALYRFQYMTNILAPSSESKISYNAYLNAGLLTASFVFLIPVYNNMPDTISPHPDSELTIPTITGTDIVYLDDDIINGTDYFNIRSGAGSEYSVIAQIVEVSEGAGNRKKFTRTQLGTNGWDKIRLSDGTEGYVSQSFVREYNYTHVDSITLDKTTASIKKGETTTLTATINPTNAFIKNVTWSSSNPSIATVDNNGKVTALAVGITNITVTTMDGNKVATCALTVDKTLASSITLPATEYPLVAGKYLQLNPVVLPETTTDKSYDIAITDTTVAVVEEGKIKGLKTGDTLVTLTTKDGSNKKVTFTLKVTEKASTIDNLTVDANNIVTKVTLGTTAASIKTNVTTSYTKKLVNVNNVELQDTDKVGTGSKIQIVNAGTVLEEYTIVIYGDVNGDAKVSSSDYVLIKNYIMSGKTTFNNIQAMGGDYNNDGKVSSSDYVLIKNYIMGY